MHLPSPRARLRGRRAGQRSGRSACARSRVEDPQPGDARGKGDYEQLLERLRSRYGHFADEKILASQLETLEEPDIDESDAITVPIDRSPEEIVSEIIAALKRPTVVS